ncbi:MAG TPA: Asp-tRNA(Asn)/Glu-tRNA(Gln) amidotransferase subunit GatB [Verrucomicrobiae bacterium]|nr:Asp-tRNA(Asn)/Glu-tRNA(Gln) amidotransferase subunit GatB [Verrucomicrobiae bacterium]
MVTANILEQYEPTIGIECHVQLKTATKLFSGADNDARDKEPNTVVSPVDFGFPGVLPVLNEAAVTLAIRAGLALKSEIARLSRFDRKHYFYPDLPKGYQITQMYQPIIGPGVVEAPLSDGRSIAVRIHHAHLEEDAGKLTHPTGKDYSLVDLNRAGTPLIEIVSEADMHSPEEAKAYAQELYLLMTYAGVTNGDLYHGNMRFDVNISVAKKSAKEWGTRAEIKNLNSFRSVEKAAEFEFKRQVALLERGEKVVQETRGWNDATLETFSQRTKEDAQDYRYFPDADIPPVVISEEQIGAVRAAMPTLPSEYRAAWQTMQLDNSVVNALLASQQNAAVVLELQANYGDATARRVAYWFASALTDIETSETTPTQPQASYFAELADMVEEKQLSSTAAKDVFNEMLRTNTPPRKIAEDKNLIQENDEAAIIAIVEEVLAAPGSQKALDDIRSGNEKAIGFLVGQAMKLSKGKAHPGIVQKLIKERI